MQEKIKNLFKGDLPKSPFFRALQTGVLALAIMAALGGVAVASDQLIFAERVYPHVYFADIDLSFKTFDETRIILEERVQNLRAEGVTFRYGDQTWRASLGDLGLTFDTDAWMNAIENEGREGNVVENMFRQIQFAFGKSELKPQIEFEQNEQFTSFVDAIAQEIETSEKDASLVVVDSKVTVSPSSTGQKIQRSGLALSLREQLRDLHPAEITIELETFEPQVLEADVEPLVETARDWAGRTAHLKYDLHDWEIKPDELAAWITTVYDQEHKQVELTVNSANGKKALETRAENGFNTQPKNAEFEIAGDKVTKFVPGENGLVLDAAQTLINLDQALADGVEQVQIATVVKEPEVKTEDINDMGITEKVGRGVSYFRGSSWARMHNIETAANKLNGVIVGPNEEFSYNDALGDISIDTGYVTGLIISKGMTVEGVGGGVCQPSTTMFRAALDGGFPITQRYEHAYRVHYYEEGGPGYESGKPGIDATVYAPSKDLRWLNDTDYSVLVQTHYDQASYRLIIDLYSTGVGRSVELSEPKVYNVTKAPVPVYFDLPDKPQDYLKQIDWAAPGCDTEFTRTITFADGTTSIETWTSHYKAWSAKYERGTQGLETTTEEGDTSGGEQTTTE